MSMGAPKVLYTMGKSRDRMYSLVESIGEGTSGLSQSGTMQSSISNVSFVFSNLSENDCVKF